MDANASISAALASLVDQNEGFAEVYDPATRRTFYVTEQTERHPLAMPETEGELRAKLDEARRDVAEGRVSTRTTEEFLAEVHRKHGMR